MASIKSAYASPAAVTITLASLATSSTLVAGQESTAIDNTANLYLDYLISGKITTGTSPTANPGQIGIWIAPLHDGTTYPDVLDGTDSAETFTNTFIRDAAAKLAAVISTNTTSDVTYWFAGISVAALFGGVVPQKFVIWVSHNSGVNLNSTAGNHEIKVTGVYATVA